MSVTLTNTTSKDINLTGDPLEVTVTPVDDNIVEGPESLVFDIIDSAWEGANPDGDYGGEGNDYIKFNINDSDSVSDEDDTIEFNSTQSTDGEDGLDTLLFSDDIDIDFTALSDSISNIEVVNLGDGDQNITSLTLEDVFDMTDDNNTLRIDGDAGDTISLDTDQVGSGEWELGDFKTDAETGATYQEYTGTVDESTVTLEISTEIQVDES